MITAGAQTMKQKASEIYESLFRMHHLMYRFTESKLQAAFFCCCCLGFFFLFFCFEMVGGSKGGNKTSLVCVRVGKRWAKSQGHLCCRKQKYVFLGLYYSNLGWVILSLLNPPVKFLHFINADWITSKDPKESMWPSLRNGVELARLFEG